jgi:hypothetical protein
MHGSGICHFLCHTFLTRRLLFLLFAVACLSSDGLSQADPEDSSPLLLSISPLAGRPGNLLKVEARGNRLDGAYAVWTGNSGITGQVLSIEEVKT